MDGIDTMRAIVAAGPDLPVLAYSTLCNIQYINSMRTRGAWQLPLEARTGG
ncbi:MAG: hypothetical protein R2810_04205 [Flavobacteriales bacterium]